MALGAYQSIAIRASHASRNRCQLGFRCQGPRSRRYSHCHRPPLAETRLISRTWPSKPPHRTHSRLERMPLKITVSYTATARRIPVECEPETTVLEMKKRLFGLAEGREQLVPEKQHLVFNGEKLENESTLEQNGVQSGDILYVVKKYVIPESEIREQGKYYITLTLPCRDTKQYVLPQTATIDDLKNKIQEEDGLLHREQRLMHKGRQVHVGFLSNYASIRGEVDFNLRTRCVISLRLQTSMGETLVYNIPDTARICKVKDSIAKTEGFSRDFNIVFAGEILDENITLGDYETAETQIGFLAFPPDEYKTRRYYKKKSDVFVVEEYRASVYHRSDDEQDLKSPRKSILRHLFKCCVR